MKIFVDTSYFLPLINIGLKEIPSDLLITLLSEESNEYFYSDLSIFEMTAKGFKTSLRKEQEITPRDIRRGIDALQNDSRLTAISYIDNPLIIELASALRAIHKDTIDCLIFASAICSCECIITMDESFFDEINENDQVLRDIREINDSFKFWLNDLSKGYETLNPIKEVE
mgnify:CR=1 FL=1